jgi:hypothetical protein
LIPHVTTTQTAAVAAAGWQAMDADVISFVKQWFGTVDVAFRPGGTLVRYPTAGSHSPPRTEAGAAIDQHIDNFS